MFLLFLLDFSYVPIKKYIKTTYLQKKSQYENLFFKQK